MPRVLVIDEDAGFSEGLRRLLSGRMIVHAASDIDSGFVLIYSNLYNALVLDPVFDHEVQGRSGLHFLHYLRDAGHLIPIVLASDRLESLEPELSASCPHVTMRIRKTEGSSMSSVASAVGDLARRHAEMYP